MHKYVKIQMTSIESFAIIARSLPEPTTKLACGSCEKRLRQWATQAEEMSTPEYFRALSSNASVQRPPPGPISRILLSLGTYFCSTQRVNDCFHVREAFHSSPAALQFQASHLALLRLGLLSPGMLQAFLSRSIEAKARFAAMLEI